LAPSPSGLATTFSRQLDASPPPDAIRVDMTGPPPRFAPTELSVSGASATFYLVNMATGVDPHSFAIGGTNYRSIVSTGPIERGHSMVFTVQDLPPGQYIFWCTISDHAALGMRGTIEVGI
jgi:plastocyanin